VEIKLTHYRNRTPLQECYLYPLNCNIRTRGLPLAQILVVFELSHFHFFFLFFTVAAIAQPVPPELVNGLKWRLIGPFRGGRVVAGGRRAGRLRPLLFWFGQWLGIWKTTDAGVVWVPIFDGRPVGSIGALAVAPSDPKIIYAGTGETDIREDLSSVTASIKSTDGGSTWSHFGLEDTRQNQPDCDRSAESEHRLRGRFGHVYGPSEGRGVYKIR